MGFSGFLAICIAGMVTVPWIGAILVAGLIFMIYGTHHRRLYLMIAITTGLIVGMIVPVLYGIDIQYNDDGLPMNIPSLDSNGFNFVVCTICDTDNSVMIFMYIIQALSVIPFLLVFVGALIIMKRKLLKPLYKELEPDED
jgi:hypothetical protein